MSEPITDALLAEIQAQYYRIIDGPCRHLTEHACSQCRLDRTADVADYVPKLAAEIRLLRYGIAALHWPRSNGVEMACYECGSPWPCPTAALLEPSADAGER